MDKTDS